MILFLMSRMITLAIYATHRREENGLYTKFTSIVVGGKGGQKLMYEKGKKNDKVVFFCFFLCKHPSVPILYTLTFFFFLNEPSNFLCCLIFLSS